MISVMKFRLILYGGNLKLTGIHRKATINLIQDYDRYFMECRNGNTAADLFVISAAPDKNGGEYGERLCYRLL